jgi:hypothetical protein
MPEIFIKNNILIYGRVLAIRASEYSFPVIDASAWSWVVVVVVAFTVRSRDCGRDRGRVALSPPLVYRKYSSG